MVKDSIIICPTRLRAIMEWERFSGTFAPAIKTINKAKLSITMKNGQKMIFMSDQEGKRMIIGDPNHFLTFRIEEFEVMLKKALEERLNAKKQETQQS